MYKVLHKSSSLFLTLPLRDSFFFLPIYMWKQTLRLNCLKHTARKCPGQDLSSLLTASELHVLATKLTGVREMARQGCLIYLLPHKQLVGIGCERSY